jgi:hypothetical protein
MISMTWLAPAQTPAVDRLVGRWSGAGTVNGQTVRAEAQFERVLQGRFTRLQYRFVAPNQTTFEGHGYYTCAGTSCRGQWFDSQGSLHVLSGTLTENALTAEWGDGTTPRGRTEYKLTSATTLTVTDWIRTTAGEWREFGRVEYRRD